VTSASIVVRRAREDDARALGLLGGALMRMHYAWDRERFMAPGSDPESGYAWWLSQEMRNAEVAVFVAERDGQVAGYVYVGVEPQSWKELRNEAGYIHDVVVDEAGRRHGVASALIDAAIAWLRERGAAHVMLWTAQQNEAAQRLFEKLGFRRTMVEMTREL
jgi:ribosomal protein S18 acetylase RimI-like enzyme